MFKGTPYVQNQVAFAKMNICSMSLWFSLWPTSYFFLIHWCNGRKTYDPARSDSLLNIHNPTMLSIWRDIVDCQLVLSRHAILKYISKYASKVKPKSESFCQNPKFLQKIKIFELTINAKTCGLLTANSWHKRNSQVISFTKF